MKELSIEEKAKRYDEAIKLAKDSFNYPDYPGFIRADVVFPEIKESEDEKVRKELLAVINDLVLPDEQKSRFIAWLEKQGEHANFRNKIEIGDKVTRNEDGVLVNLSQLKRVAKKDEKQGQQKSIKEHDICDTCDEKTSCVIPCPVKLVEQKFADKVEPIFNIGDTIAKKHNSDIHDFGSFTITDITGGKYWYNDRIICDITEQDNWELYEPVRQKPAWSEEDKYKISRLTSYLKRLGNDVYVEWLESLKEKYSWKPSDEQMKALENAMSMGAKLDSLYNELKKLKD